MLITLVHVDTQYVKLNWTELFEMGQHFIFKVAVALTVFVPLDDTCVTKY